MRPVQATGAVVELVPAGAYHRLVLAVPGWTGRAAPGQFVALAVGGPQTSMLLRRCFSVYRSGPGEVEVVFAAGGPGTRWLAGCRPGDRVDVVGPLGEPFGVPARPTGCVLVGGGYGAAPLLTLAADLLAAGHAVRLVLGAATAGRLFGVQAARHIGCPVSLTTDDGSAGVPGLVTAVLPAALHAARAARPTGSVACFACGPMGMLAAVAALAADAGVPSQCAVEEAMACGTGICMTCVLPIVGADGRTRMVRSCLDGPVFAGDRIRFDAVGTVPPDCVGAPGPGTGGLTGVLAG